MKLSVCCITYNHERYLARALDGIVAQQLEPPWEVLIGEDCSTDQTGEIVRQYAARHPSLVRALPTPANLGEAGKVNFLRTLAACTGEYVALLEGDDYWTNPEKLARQVAFLDANPKYSFCFHPVDQVDSENRMTGTFPQTRRNEFKFEDLFPHNFIPTCSVVFRRRLCSEFPDWFLQAQPGDWPLHMLNAQHGPFRMLPEVMGAYRIHPEGAWSSQRKSARHEETLRMLSAAREQFSNEHHCAFDRTIAIHRFEFAWVLAVDQKYTEARQVFAAFCADPTVSNHVASWKRLALWMNIRFPSLVGLLAALRRSLLRRHPVRPADFRTESKS